MTNSKNAFLGTAAAAAGLGLYTAKSRAKEPFRGPWEPTKDSIDWDYIVLGGGTAGCVVASRLAEDPGVRVLVLEAGYTDNIMKSKVPALMSIAWHSEVDYQFKSVQQLHVDNRRLVLPRGKLLGGSSSINVMIYTRGPASDYDEWETLGNPGWSYKDMLPYHKKAEGFSDPSLPPSHPKGPLTNRTRTPEHETFEPEYHGSEGPWQVSYHYLFGAVDSFIKASVRAGVPANIDFNGASAMGVSRFQTTIQRDAVRSSTARAYLSPERLSQPGRGTVRIVFGAKVVRILVHKKKGVKCVSGVEFLDENSASGIGPSPHPSIPHVHTLPGVGQHLQDHLGVAVCFRTESSTIELLSTSLPSLPSTLYSYFRHGTGPMSSVGVESAAFVRLEDIAPDFVAREKAQGTWQDPTSSRKEAPHVEIIFVPTFMSDANLGPNNSPKHACKKGVDDGLGQGYFTMFALLLNPVSKGTVSISNQITGDGRLQTLIDPEFFSDPFDLRVMTEGVRFIRKIAREMAKDPKVGPAMTEVFPSEKIAPDDDDAAIHRHIREHVQVFYHPTSTCRMGPASDPMAVVDPRLNVYGVERLRIVDASVFPKIPATHTCAPTVCVAEKAADMIKEDWQDPTRATIATSRL
ncbi:hypothetical protein DFQ27_003212 [Actinomortierella ambigua]|uniref:Glucose-methanol-choline oxidoreductase N-terminal domain-containing protein n=1 Tax=Actinomortierella ambigua TaxID=1343610 RepID=A0A9P6QI85_9FUNG|nr:hypothetical protein DFQ27_003212 [Actinomortierella ambigua]